MAWRLVIIKRALQKFSHNNDLLVMPDGVKGTLDQVLTRTQTLINDVQNRDAARLHILEYLPEALIMLDENLIIVRGNAAARDLFHIDEIANKPVHTIIHEKSIIDALQTAITQKASSRLDYAYAPQGKAMRHFKVLIDHIPHNPNGRTRVVMMLHDMTAAKLIEQSNADFVANASHELRTPLTALSGFIETLQQGAADDIDARTEFLGIMNTQTDRMIGLVNDLLSLSRIQRSAHLLPTDIVDLAPVIAQEVKALTMRAQKQGMRFDCDLQDCRMQGDQEELGQLFQNLFSNAIKYGFDNTHIAVVMHIENNMCSVKITNKGLGIDASDIPRLTERFFRTQSAKSGGMKGTGLGLAIVKHIINRHQGNLKITSKRGEETIFNVVLPIYKDQAISAE